MKRIKLTHVSKGNKKAHYTKQKRHHVPLGNGLTAYFSDHKQAVAFLVKTNRFLNEKLFEVNAFYIEIFTEYRKSWFYFSNRYDQKLNFASGKNLLFQDFILIENKLNLMTDRYHVVNGNYYVFIDFIMILEKMEHLVTVISDLYKDKKYYAEYHQLEILTRRIKLCWNEISTYGCHLLNAEFRDN